MNQLEVIKQIEQLGGQYDPNCGLDGCFTVWDQLLTCEAIAESTPVKERCGGKEDNFQCISDLVTHVDDNVNDNVNDIKIPNGHQFGASKEDAFNELKKCIARTSPKKIAYLLDIIFRNCDTHNPTHWLYVAQTWAPRPVVRVIIHIQDQIARGKKIQNTAALFTYLIKKRVPRSKFQKKLVTQVDDIKQQKTKKPMEVINDTPPHEPCYCCKSTDYWQRWDGEWICSICHPPIVITN